MLSQQKILNYLKTYKEKDLEEAFGKDVDVIALWKQMNPKLRSRIEKDVIYV